MTSLFKDYIWPEKCPRCRRKMRLLDRVHRLTLSLAWVVSLTRGKAIDTSARPINKCDFCHR
ncbi:hypothetical protein CLV84_2582 [Neolewinella xylanilytica]|uniref:Uncharacterized protein n=1 Tax=Neolewinella xylanilytica TaxID=1514080 RepID=A0A2S6I3P9_9BACT|nr:hypothetical protein [Neolewinella xylanilytica]PPK85679.1 hypothetical protein CLV84_2582 [Neolewinella xylanilytica]